MLKILLNELIKVILIEFEHLGLFIQNQFKGPLWVKNALNLLLLVYSNILIGIKFVDLD